MPGIQWAVLAPEADEIHLVGSWAQAWAVANTWHKIRVDPAVIVARAAAYASWTTSDGATYRDPRPVGEAADVDMMADPDNAAMWLTTIDAMVADDPLAVSMVLSALRHEAVAHGHDIPED